MCELALRKRLEMFERGGWGEEADDDEAEERGDQRREDGVALANDRWEVWGYGVPGDGDDCTYGNAGYGGSGGCALPEESCEDDRCEGRRVDRVGVEGLLRTDSVPRDWKSAHRPRRTTM